MSSTTNLPGMTPPPIAPVPAGIHRPLWSVMIPTFNCAKYLRQTLESVLAQDPGPEQMQIEVVDDCSTKDDPEAVVRELGNGRVVFYRKPKNEGAIANFNTCIERSRGHLIHILHGDDYVLPGFYDEILKLRSACPTTGLIACRNFVVDESNIIRTVSNRTIELESGGHCARAFYYENSLQFSGVVVRRDFYELHGGFIAALVHTADCEMWVRVVSTGGGIVSSNVLSVYRHFETNDTGKLMQTGENLRDLQRMHELFLSKFPDFDRYKAKNRVMLLAFSQYQNFLACGNNVAAELNLQLFHSLKSAEPLLKRVCNKIINVLQVLGSN
jgi:glycosyltransferase involved in cell wall biosynthesis